MDAFTNKRENPYYSLSRSRSHFQHADPLINGSRSSKSSSSSSLFGKKPRNSPFVASNERTKRFLKQDCFISMSLPNNQVDGGHISSFSGWLAANYGLPYSHDFFCLIFPLPSFFLTCLLVEIVSGQPGSQAGNQPNRQARVPNFRFTVQTGREQSRAAQREQNHRYYIFIKSLDRLLKFVNFGNRYVL